MRDKSDNVVEAKSYEFALSIIMVYKQLTQEKKEFVLSKQLVRSGTSVGANVREATCAESKRDFVHKLNIALKEAREAGYWLELLKDSEYIGNEVFLKVNAECNEVVKIISSIILTTKSRYLQEEDSDYNLPDMSIYDSQI